MDAQRFQIVVDEILSEVRERDGIGTYGEKTLHLVLKNYFEPYRSGHEKKIGGFIADIVGENGIIEIQTAGFDKLRKKLACFLEVGRVTVVYPIAAAKRIIQINPETAELGKTRMSPKRGTPYEIFPELYKIKSYLKNENLHICIVMLDIDEYRQPPETDKLRRGRRKGYTRYDRIPTLLRGEIRIDTHDDWLKLIPIGLAPEFTSKDFAEKAKINLRRAGVALNILTEVGAVTRIGKVGNAYLYTTKQETYK